MISLENLAICEMSPNLLKQIYITIFHLPKETLRLENLSDSLNYAAKRIRSLTKTYDC